MRNTGCVISEYFNERNVNTHLFITEMDGDTLDYIESAFKRNSSEDIFLDIIELIVCIAAKELNISFDDMAEKPINEDWFEFNLIKMGGILEGIIKIEKLRRSGKARLEGEYSLTSPYARVFSNEDLGDKVL